jgi:hypothetical protein
MNSTVPAANPPNRIPAISATAFTGAPAGQRLAANGEE